ncbi:NAD-dependent epimerase/dehydratase family protein [Jannaschia sp. S6380]|uniref:NAD-dependent epimerase/dehydratase family protein n=1 Tax=Jannaschia sp. S6380 TaxID=2926408 RepID=UPI001FF45445|nr:NAD-dependent epimerase/dehydratase family protein [Jannaschia sp. S6380]MCK0168320.1 NAD-dependent epimerase/dehydratase family protein [Jannaschia sp. S6380]
MKNSSSLVLVGGLGFVGRNILEAIGTEAGFADLAPSVIDDLSNPAPGHDALDLPMHLGGYQSEGAIDFLEGMEAGPAGRTFVFLAGETRVAESKDRPLDFIEANIADPSRFVMQAVRPGDRFILVSTAGALFDGTFEVSVDSPYCPKNFYGATKAAEEMILEKLVALRGGTFRVVRLTNVFGRYSDNKKSAIHAFTRAAIEGRQVFVNGDGGQSRDFIYAGDVGRGIATLARKLAAGEETDPVNMLGSGRSTSLMDVIAAVEKAAGKPLAYEKVPAEDLLATEPRDVIANPRDVRVLLGDGVTDLERGIAETHAYYAR